MDNIDWDRFNEQDTHDHFKDLVGSDFYFAYGLDYRLDSYFAITPKKYFDKYGYMFDQHIQDVITHILPMGEHAFFEDMEGCFTYDGDDVLGRRMLASAGFVENADILNT